MSTGVNALDRNKWTYEELFAYFEEIATESEHIKGFTRVDVMNLNRDKHYDLSTPFLGLEDPAIAPKHDTDDDIQWVWNGGFIICTEVEREDESGYQEAMSKAGMILQKICAWILNDRELGHIVDFRFSQMKGHPVKQVFRNCAGYRMTFTMPSQFDMGMYDADWKSWRQGQALPPFSRVFDGGQWNPLKVGEEWVCSSADGTVNIYNSQGVLVGSVTVAPGATENGVAPDAGYTMNGDGPYGIPSGEVTPLYIRYDNGTEVGDPQLDGGWLIPNPPPDVDIAVSDATPKYGDVITLTATGDTPFDDIYWLIGNADDGYEFGTGQDYDWTVNRTGDIVIVVLVVKDGVSNWKGAVLTATLEFLIETDADGYGWYDATDTSDVTAVTENSGKASALIDKLGNILDAANTNAASQPAFLLDDANGKDGLEFLRGNSSKLEFTGGDVTNHTDLTFLFAMRPTDTWSNTTDRMFSTWKQGENDFSGNYSAAWIEALQVQKAGYSSFKHNLGSGLHVFCGRYSQAAGYYKLSLVVDGKLIDSEDLTSTASDLGAVIENLRIGYQVSMNFYQLQIFSRVLTDQERDDEIMKLCYQLAGTI